MARKPPEQTARATRTTTGTGAAAPLPAAPAPAPTRPAARAKTSGAGPFRRAAVRIGDVRGVVFQGRGRLPLADTPLAVVVAGAPFEVRYDRGAFDVDGQGELERIVLCWRIDGGAVQVQSMADGARDPVTGFLVRSPAVIDVPADAHGVLEYWFKLDTVDGRVLWDSDFGRNYKARIQPVDGTTIAFLDGWTTHVDGPLVTGARATIRYAAGRARCVVADARAVVAYMSIEGARPIEIPLAADEGAFTARIELPTPGRVSLWFRVDGATDVAWDSRLGANYDVEVVR